MGVGDGGDYICGISLTSGLEYRRCQCSINGYSASAATYAHATASGTTTAGTPAAAATAAIIDAATTGNRICVGALAESEYMGQYWQ